MTQQQTMQQNKKPINPILAYLGFTRRTVLTKKSIIICFSIFLALALLFGILPSIMYSLLECNSAINDSINDPTTSSTLLGVMNNWKSLSSTMLVVECTVFAFNAALIGTLVFLTIFKDGESDGTELITVSKPISRHQILTSRYIFTFVFALCIALIHTLLAGINYGIVSLTCNGGDVNWMKKMILYPGINDAGPGYFGGIFGGSILSFFLFGLIAAAMSNIAGGKTTRIVSLLVMFFSFGVVSISSQLLPALTSNPVLSSINKKAHKTIDSFKGKTLQEINDQTHLPIFAQGTSTGSSDEILFNEYKNLKITDIHYWDYPYGDIYSYDYIYDLNMYTIQPNFGHINVFFEADPHDTYGGGQTLDNFFSEQGNVLNKYIIDQVGSTPASGAVALTYLNPMSSMLGIMTQNLQTIQSLGVPYNWAVTKLLPMPSVSIPGSGSSSKNSPTVWIADYNVADPNWGLMLMWIAICGILGALTTVGYLRKDFK